MFSDRSIIELVTTGSVKGNKPALLFWNGHKGVVMSQIVCKGQIYRPIDLHSSLKNAIRFPVGAVSYGTTRKLFTEVARLFERHIGFSKPEATAIAIWSATTWFPDCLPSPPALLITGPAMSQAITLFRLLHCLCRHPLMLADVSRSAIRSLPMDLRPTLIVNQAHLSRTVTSLLWDSNYRGLFIPGRGGAVLDLVCSKAIFTAMADLPEQCNDQALHIALPPAHSELQPLDEREQDTIANRFQPRWLLYRLQHANKVCQARSAACGLTFPTLELARNLMACIPDEPEFVQALVPLLQSQEQDILARRSCDLSSAIVEVLWAKLHEPSREATVSQVADLANALLRHRGEIREYSAAEVGWKLRDLGIPRHRGRNSMAVQFSREISRRVHQLARGFALQSLKHCPNRCADCTEVQIVGPKKIAEVS
jgi:hypothetical protein